MSLPARGAWIEISQFFVSLAGSASLPARGAWIEITNPFGLIDSPLLSLPARGAWIEIDIEAVNIENIKRRSPHGERGLKSNQFVTREKDAPVAPRTGSVD